MNSDRVRGFGRNHPIVFWVTVLILVIVFGLVSLYYVKDIYLNLIWFAIIFALGWKFSRLGR